MNISIRKRAQKRQGAAIVEFALVAPIMIMLTFGLVEIGRIMLVKQSAVHATREGARVSVRPTADDNDVIDRVNEELAIFGVNNALIEMDPSPISSAEPGETVLVRVSIDPSEVTWVPGMFNWAGSQIVAESSMRRESTQ